MTERKALGHVFKPYGDEEMICHQCDYVIGVPETDDEARKQVILIAGHEYHCPAATGAA